eukprot:TRINITY_DN7001_c0_g1_i1.p1 TRINITY_DN7001_c0_g1~~TRINITY_DN7001_c0_g1_i1.p1  ORF type:complete len:509 (+),score=216.38 TRINITY_DN7001_c0_g1_i1:97-1527(+)
MPTGRAGVTDYSKWDRLDDSDDEKHAHPNIDIGLQRRIQRELRGRRFDEDSKKKQELDEANKRDQERIKVIDAALEAGEGDTAGLKQEREALQNAITKRREKMVAIDEHAPLYVDGASGQTNMYKEVLNYGGVNRDCGDHKDGFVLPERDEKDDAYHRDGEDKDGMQFFEFGEKHKGLLEQFVKLGAEQMSETMDFLIEHAKVMLQEHALAWTKLKALEYEMAGQRAEMKHACRQQEVLFAIAELAKVHRRHPGNLIRPFIEGLKDPKRFSAFVEGVEHFAQQIAQRAVAKRKEQELGLQPGQDPYEEGTLVEAQGLKGAAQLNGLRGRICGKQGDRVGVLFPEPHGRKALKKENLIIVQVSRPAAEEQEVEEEAHMPRPEDCTDPDKLWWLPYHLSPEERKGPGGLDPCEVFKELPDSMKDAFRTREIKPLQDAIAAMSDEEARLHLDKCIKAGLWNPGGADADDDDADAAGPDQ